MWIFHFRLQYLGGQWLKVRTIAKWGLLHNSRPEIFALMLIFSFVIAPFTSARVLSKPGFRAEMASGIPAALRKELWDFFVGVIQWSVVGEGPSAKCEVCLCHHVLSCPDEFPCFEAWQHQRALQNFWQRSGTPVSPCILPGEILVL